MVGLYKQAGDKTGCMKELNYDDDLVVLDRYLVHPQSAFVGQAGTGEQIELPAMPRTSQNLAVAAPDPFTWSRRKCGTSQTPETDRRKLVRADVQHGHKAAMNIEDADRPSLHRNDPPRTGWNLFGSGDGVLPPAVSRLSHAQAPAADTEREPFRASHDPVYQPESCAPRNPGYRHPNGGNRLRTSACDRRGTSQASF